MKTKLHQHSTPDSAISRPDPAAEIAFAPFHIDLRRGLLFRGRGAIPLRPKTWSVLLHLAERPGLLVTKDDLLDALWPDVAVGPETLGKSIGELRAALDDDKRTPRFIQTVNRRGYRFIAQTEVAGSRFTASGYEEQPGTGNREPATVTFVGREAELQLLATSLAKAHAGERQIVFVTGAAGVGKTALIDAFLASQAVCESRVPLWIGRAGCFEHHGPQEPYQCVFGALERLTRPPNVERLVRLMRRAAPMWLAQMPWLVGEADAEGLRSFSTWAFPTMCGTSSRRSCIS